MAPELIIDSGYVGSASVVLPLFLSVTVVTVAVVLTVHHFKKKLLIQDGRFALKS